MLKLMLIILIGLTTLSITGCGSIKYKNVHRDLVLKPMCPYDPLTLDERLFLKKQPSESVGQKIYANKKSCIRRAELNQGLVAKHNECHRHPEACKSD